MGRTSAELTNIPPLALWKETFDVLGLEISLPAPSARLSCNSTFHGMRLYDLGICVCYKEIVQFL